MDKEIKEEWINELKSGKYTQGTSALKRKKDCGRDDHCCLGVLAEILIKKYPAKYSFREPNIYKNNYYSFIAKDFNGTFATECILPSDNEVELLTGVDFDTQNHLSCMNDNGSTFKEIAGYIKENL